MSSKRRREVISWARCIAAPSPDVEVCQFWGQWGHLVFQLHMCNHGKHLVPWLYMSNYGGLIISWTHGWVFSGTCICWKLCSGLHIKGGIGAGKGEWLFQLVAWGQHLAALVPGDATSLAWESSSSWGLHQQRTQESSAVVTVAADSPSFPIRGIHGQGNSLQHFAGLRERAT